MWGERGKRATSECSPSYLDDLVNRTDAAAREFRELDHALTALVGQELAEDALGRDSSDLDHDDFVDRGYDGLVHAAWCGGGGRSSGGGRCVHGERALAGGKTTSGTED
jgi:hypothetical protein